ncbi:Asx homology domain-containing protein [Hypoxylon sp. FL0890]|nr:Asx homology domain-containing protein [Hypoxylon sp. FL0890]
MPARKKSNDATASQPAEPTRRSTRTSKKSTPKSTNSSEDDNSSPKPALSGDTTNSPIAISNQQDETAQEITVRTTRAKSYTSSRPSTPNSDAASQSHQVRIVPTPVAEKDVEMHDVRTREEDELPEERPAQKKSKASAKETSASTRKGRSKYNNPIEMLTNPRSPLATAKLRDLLLSSNAWDILSPEEQQSILAKFPDSSEILDAGTENARPNIAALRNNDNFRHDVARYQEDLRKGWHDPEWIRQAQAAHRKREVGAYDEFLAARFEEEWGMARPGQNDSQEANWGSDDEDEKKDPEEMSKQASEAQKNEGDQDSDGMTGVEITAQENDEGRPSKEEPEKADDHEGEQTHPSDVSMGQDEVAHE